MTSNKHIVGKVYDVTAESINKLITELEYTQQQLVLANQGLDGAETLSTEREELDKKLAAMAVDRKETLRSLAHCHKCYMKSLAREAELVEVLREIAELPIRDLDETCDLARIALEANKRARGDE